MFVACYALALVVCCSLFACWLLLLFVVCGSVLSALAFVVVVFCLFVCGDVVSFVLHGEACCCVFMMFGYCVLFVAVCRLLSGVRMLLSVVCTVRRFVLLVVVHCFFFGSLCVGVC